MYNFLRSTVHWACFSLLQLGSTASGYGQIKFEKGYYINNENVRTECLIRNNAWRYNPSFFEHKLTENDKSVKMQVADVREFGVLGSSKYIRAKVKMDRSVDFTSDIDVLSESREPDWHEEQIFLKVIVEGKASLYAYEESNFTRYFYSLGNDSIEQLIYKAFKVGQLNMDYNKTYQSQLSEFVDCGDLANRLAPKTDYWESSLKKYFVSYNQCKGSTVTEIESKKSKSFTFSLLAGINFSTFQAGYVTDGNIATFYPKNNMVVGAELEYIFPFNKNKWSIPLQIYNRSYSSTGQDSFYLSHIDYKAIEFAIGPRYTIFLNGQMNLFINALIVEDIQTSSSYYWKTTDQNYNYPMSTFEIKSITPIIAGGLGFSFRNLSAEFRYYSNRELFESYTQYGSKLTSFSIFLKYKLFKF